MRVLKSLSTTVCNACGLADNLISAANHLTAATSNVAEAVEIQAEMLVLEAREEKEKFLSSRKTKA